MAAHVDCVAYAPVTPGFWLGAPSGNQIVEGKRSRVRVPPCQPWSHIQSSDQRLLPAPHQRLLPAPHQRLLPALLYLIGSLVVIRAVCETLEFFVLAWIRTVLSGFLIKQAMWLFLTQGWTRGRNQPSFLSFLPMTDSISERQFLQTQDRRQRNMGHSPGNILDMQHEGKISWDFWGCLLWQGHLTSQDRYSDLNSEPLQTVASLNALHFSRILTSISCRDSKC